MNLTPLIWNWPESAAANHRQARHLSDSPIVWQAGLPEDPAIQASLANLLTVGERQRLARLRQPADQHRYLTGRGLLRLLAGAWLNRPPQELQIDQGPFGKPFLVLPAGAAPLHFNLSHSGSLVLLAFSQSQAVGVDVEYLKYDQDWEPIAARVFSSAEYQDWLRTPAEKRTAAFFQRWTRHEARLKALGLGFADSPSDQTKADLRCFDLDLPEGYAGSLASL